MRPSPVRPSPRPLRARPFVGSAPALLVAVLALLAGVAFADVPAGDRLSDRGDFRGAAAEYARAVASDPADVEARARLARATTYLAGTLTGDAAEEMYEEAVGHAREAVAAGPGHAEAHFELARALGRLAQFKGVLQSLNLADEVQEELELALELDPEHAGAMHALALWHLNVPWIAGGRRGRVRPLFERAIELEPDAVTHRVDYGEALIGLEEPEAARAQLEAALALPARTWSDERDQEKARELLGSL